MMGRQGGDQSQLFYLFNLERRIPGCHLLRRINPEVTRVVADLHETLAPVIASALSAAPTEDKIAIAPSQGYFIRRF
jgi:hypothetical protein